MNEREAILVQTLADVDCVWRPFRGPWGPSSSSASVVSELRRSYDECGFPWVSAGRNEAERKAHQRELESLVTMGLMEAIRAQGRSTGVKLTDRGEQTARALVGQGGIMAAVPIVKRLLELKAESSAYSEEFTNHVPETRLTGVAWGDPKGDRRGRNAFGKLQAKLVPALVRGWVEANSSVGGHVWYRPIELGEVEKVANLPAADDEAWQCYEDRFGVTLARLHNQAPESFADVGIIPLPVSFALVGYDGTTHIVGPA